MEIGEEEGFDLISYSLLQSDGFILSQIFILAVCSLMSFAAMVGDLSRFLD